MWSLSRALVSLPVKDNRMTVRCCKGCMCPIHLHICGTFIQLLSGSTFNHPAFIHLFFSVVVFEFLSFLHLFSVRNSGRLPGDEIIDRMWSLAIKLLANISLWCLNSACWDTRKRIERYQRTRYLLWLPNLMLPRMSLSSSLLLWVYDLDPIPFTLVPLEK